MGKCSSEGQLRNPKPSRGSCLKLEPFIMVKIFDFFLLTQTL